MSSIPSNYEINVAKKKYPDDPYGVYWCKIQIPEVFDEEAEKKLNYLRNLFGTEYNLSMTHWICRGEVKEGWK